MKPAPASFSANVPLLWLALGTFAIGTEGFMIAPLLPDLASDLGVSVAAAGQLVTVFALTYAVSSPILTALTGNFDRRRLLILAMVGFALANIVAFTAKDYWSLMSARVLLAIAAGLYVPNANALAGALVPPHRRGTALAIVNGGSTIAIALGVPLGSIVGYRFGWRMNFAGVGVLAVIATTGLTVGLQRGIGAGLAVASLGERFAVVRRPTILLALLVTTLWATGAYTVYTYFAPFLAQAADIRGAQISLVMFLWGIAAAAGLFIGGSLSDRFGPPAVAVPALFVLAFAFLALSATASFLPPARAEIPVLVISIIWGAAAWAFFPAQQARLIGVGGIKVAPVTLSLNASFMFIGFSLGAALGSLCMGAVSTVGLGWIGAICEGFALLAIAMMSPARKPAAVIALGE